VIVLVRHGRTAMNASGRLLGRLDPPLDEVGERQVEAVAGVLGELQDPHVVTSPLTRTRQTAAVIAARLGVEAEIDERWIELDFGTWDGIPVGDVPAETWRAWRADVDLRPPGGETLAELSVRVRAALAALGGTAVERDVVVVSHVTPIKAAVAWALGVTDDVTWRMRLGQAAISRLEVGELGATLLSFNESGHLAPLGTPPR
jgi:broad specificity phosphatase PhoE